MFKRTHKTKKKKKKKKKSVNSMVSFEIIESVKQKGKRMNKSGGGECLRDSRDTIRWTNTHIMKVLGERERETNKCI